MVARNSNIETLKLQFLRDFLEIQDVDLVQKLLRMVQSSYRTPVDENAPVGYHPNGDPITLAELHSDIEESVREYQMGKVTSLEDFEREIESWK